MITHTGWNQAKNKAQMLQWLESTMAAANTKQAREQHPWIIVHFHRPAYSTGGVVVYRCTFAHSFVHA